MTQDQFICRGDNGVTALSRLSGCELATVVKHDFAWGFVFSGNWTLNVECLWRLILSNRLTVTSMDHGHQFGLPEPVDCIELLKQHLVGQSVSNVSSRTGTVDIVLEFGPQCVLEVIATSAGYEGWQLFGNGVLIVGSPGHED